MQFNFFGFFHLDGLWALLAYGIVALIVAFPLIVILLENRNPIKSLSWIMILVLVPLVGIILYLYFGRNLRKEKIFTKKEISDAESARLLMDTHGIEIEEISSIATELIKSKKHLMKLLFNNSRATLTQKNRVKILNNGAETFDCIIEDLRQSIHHIHLEYYIIEDDEIGNRIREILMDKAKEGIKVRVIFDDVGSWGLRDKFLNPMREAGIEFYSFMPVKTYRFANKINYRNHRKIIVIDGLVGFVGGLNIADRYLKGRDGKGFWRDTHLKIVGDAVLSLQVIFITDWYFMSTEMINGEVYFPETPFDENHLVQIATSGPDSDWSSIMQTFFSAIATAKDCVYISTPYFLPNEGILVALRTVALSGVDVKIILPEKNDSFLTNWSSRSYIQNLLEAGIEVYFYQKGYTHSKLLMVDKVFATVGTANMDIRSFDQNFEVNALLYDEELTAELNKAFFQDLANSVQVKLDVFSQRSLIHKFKESFARLFSPLL
jgi:cardiolipin synthase A/B